MHSHSSPWLQQDFGGMGIIGVPEITLIVPTLLRGNAAQDAPRPILNVAQSFVGGMTKLQRLLSYN